MSNNDNDEQGASAQTPQASPFDAIRQEDAQGNEWWSARELAQVLGYATNYRNFQPVIRRAEQACEASGYPPSDHFAHVRNMVTIGSGAQRNVVDVHLSRYACYLIVQNADPEKPIVALGQTYFAVQTRRQELADEQALHEMSDDQQRLYLRNELVARNKQLADAAAGAGIITGRDFAIFQDHGYMGLYAGERARDIHTRKGLKRSQRILDHMGHEELAANWFRATQADAKIRREGITGKDQANATHHAVGRAVRKTIADLGGTMPEELPTPPESIQRLLRKEQQRIEQKRQPSLFREEAEDGRRDDG